MRIALVVAGVAGVIALIAWHDDEATLSEPAERLTPAVPSAPRRTDWSEATRFQQRDFTLIPRVADDEAAAPFREERWVPPQAPPPVNIQPQVVVQPVAPPLPFRFVGKLEQEGKVTYVLAQDSTTHYVVPGDTINGTYRVAGVRSGQMELVFLPLGEVQFLHLPESTEG